MLQELVEGQENLYPVGLEGQASEDHLTSIESLDQEYNIDLPTLYINLLFYPSNLLFQP